jgi:uncharacterized protein YndB with AHSA1/START domain
MVSSDARSVSHQYFIRAPPEEVFRAISEPKGLTRWLCDRAEVAANKGGRYLLGWTDGPTHSGDVVEFEPGRRMALAWSWPGVDLRGTIFSLAVEAKDDGTLFMIEHSGFPRDEKWTDLYGGAEWGWTYFAMNLKSVLESGRDLRSPRDG